MQTSREVTVVVEGYEPDDIEATGIFLRLVGDAARRLPDGSAPDVCKLLLSASTEWLAEALAEIRAREWQRGYEQCRRDHLNGMVAHSHLFPDAPTREELGRLRHEHRDPTSPSGWSADKSENEYYGGRWPGRPKPSENLNWTGNE